MGDDSVVPVREIECATSLLSSVSGSFQRHAVLPRSDGAGDGSGLTDSDCLSN
jgi:hypothetical protein